jgi:hypothetical protein
MPKNGREVTIMGCENVFLPEYRPASERHDLAVLNAPVFGKPVNFGEWIDYQLQEVQADM